MYITTTDELRAVVDKLSASPVVGVDTEFMREKTYFARLCLIQIADAETSAIIDPLVIDDMGPFCELMWNASVLKVFHAGGQDYEIINRLCGKPAAPVFDTQVAATLAGFPQQVGYGALVHELLGEKLDKGATYTDWSRRPLSETQVTYALNDVRYLPPVYDALMESLNAEGRMEWLSTEFVRLVDPATYAIEPLEQWRRVKRIASLNRRQLAVAREVAAWRETEAMRRDVPKRWVLGDESIIEVSRRAPGSAEELLGIRGVGDKLGRAAARSLVEAVARGVAVSDEDLPFLPKKRRITADVDGAVDLMIALVRKRARENGVAMPLLGSRDDLERLAAGEREGHPLLGGWKATMVGNELVELLDGRLTMRLSEGELVVEAPDEKA